MEPNLDAKGRRRNRTVAFRVSEEEGELLNRLVSVSGMTKQDYIIDRLSNRDVVVYGNPKVYKALRTQMGQIHEELRRIGNASDVPDELMTLIGVVANVMEGMKENSRCIERK